jgi:CIC family chloride channel protein
MGSPTTTASEGDAEGGNLAGVILLALIAGGLSGLVAALFRVMLEHAERWRGTLIAQAHDHALLGFLLVISATAIAAALGAWLVRRFSPEAGGSGIPHVEAVVTGDVQHPAYILAPIKLLGGWLAIGGGLALGREGPCVQVGATISSLLGKLFRLGSRDRLTLFVAGAGAGLATAFNAPLGGAVFVLEELVRRFDTRFAIAALAASAGAVAVAPIVLREAPALPEGSNPQPGDCAPPLVAALGVVAGLRGDANNQSIDRA